MHPLFVFVAVYAVLRSIRRLFNRRPISRARQDHEALVRAKAALICMIHMETLLQAVDAELARRAALRGH